MSMPHYGNSYGTFIFPVPKINSSVGGPTLIIATEALSSASEFSCFLFLIHELLKPLISWSIRTDEDSQIPWLSFKEKCTLLNAPLIKLHFFLPPLVYLWCFSVSFKKVQIL